MAAFEPLTAGQSRVTLAAMTCDRCTAPATVAHLLTVGGNYPTNAAEADPIVAQLACDEHHPDDASYPLDLADFYADPERLGEHVAAKSWGQDGLRALAARLLVAEGDGRR